ncbi:hypothetical protein WDJ51_04065 [Rathayibacter sp. YIM 133350]|uniref:hypothetical protein n=1 Tax=Rathayibacter sp. YIM 133350 TaxID=3131992 RepID=UPI00307EC6E2
MRLRDRPFEHATMVRVVGPVTPDGALAFRRGLREYLRSDEGGELRRVRDAPGARWRVPRDSEIDALADAAVIELDDGMDAETLVKAGIEQPVLGLPLRIRLSGALVGFDLPHELFDGTSAGIEGNNVIALAAGMPLPHPHPQRVKRPLLVLARRFSLFSPTRLRAARDHYRQVNRGTACAYQASATLTKQQSVALTRLVHLKLDGQTMARIGSLPSTVGVGVADGDSRRRAPASIKLGSTLLAALEEIGPPEVDFRVRIPVDLRRYFRRTDFVPGNLTASLTLGTLRGGNWSPSVMTAALARSIKAGDPVVWFLADALNSARSAFKAFLAPGRRRSGGVARRPFEIRLSLPSGDVVDMGGLWASSTERVVGATTAHELVPLGVYIECASVGSAVHVMLWDETGLFDVDDFERAFHAELDRRGGFRAPRVAAGSDRASA